jgi:hypothetical protein
MLTLKKED